ncbi:MAG: 4-hydroxyphenylacetate 3-hydroxylase N-terminal domain-containing protein [Syntrophorhabdales bacterium]|jgi:4-hydroxybutyryl-CoA dehydratase/vinylacetyl-CoA-Delta-isomerase
MRDAQQYIESLRDGREVYIHGERVDDITKHPSLRKAIDHGALDYELDKRPDLHDLLVTRSSETGHEIRRYFELPGNPDDLLRRQQVIETTTREGASIVIFMKEIGTDALNALAMVCYDMDKRYGTGYAERAAKYRQYLEENDLSMAGAVTDVKGDRSLRPSQQKMPYYYLKVVERQPGGVVVRGCKVHTTSAPITNELLVLPTRAMTEDDRDYCIAFGIPVNTKGVKIISRPERSDLGPFDYPLSSRHTTLEAMTIFDDVFVPAERIFMDGEWEFAGILANCFATWHRFTGISYKYPFAQMMIGAAALIADYNGVPGASHIRDRITDLVVYAQSIKTFGQAAARECVVTENGIACPNPLLCNIGKYLFAANYHASMKALQEVAGGLVATGPTEADCKNPATREFIERYLGGRSGVPAMSRLKVMKLIRDMGGTDGAGEWWVGTLHGEGSLQAQRMSIGREFDVAGCVDYVKKLLEVE